MTGPYVCVDLHGLRCYSKGTRPIHGCIVQQLWSHLPDEEGHDLEPGSRRWNDDTLDDKKMAGTLEIGSGCCCER